MPEEVKLRRLQEIIAAFRENMLLRNKQTEDRRLRLVLIEGLSSKATADDALPLLTGRTDGNKRILFNTVPSQLVSTPFDSAHVSRIQSILKKTPNSTDIFTTAIENESNDWYSRLLSSSSDYSTNYVSDCSTNSSNNNGHNSRLATADELRGKYAVVHVHNANGQTLRGRVLGITSMAEFHRSLYPSLLATGTSTHQ